MKYLVEYYSESGTSSDNEFIGFFDTREEAEIAKNEYINETCGTLEEWLKFDTEDEYYETLEYYRGCVGIEEVHIHSI